MATKLFYTGIDLQQNELQNAVLQPLATAPSNPIEGQIYYNTTDGEIYSYNGTSWDAVGANQVLTVAADSQAFVSITDNELSFNNLAITEVHVDITETTMADFITNNYSAGTEFQEGDMIILTNATDQSQRSWIHNGGTSGNSNDFTRLQTDLNATEVKSLFTAGSGLSYTDGEYSVSTDGITKDMINADVAGNGLGQNADGSLEVKVDNSSIKIVSDTLTVDGDVIGTALAGNGIVKNGNTLDVNVDDSTVEILSDTVQVKDGGITQTKLDSNLEAKIVNGYAETVGNGTSTSFTITHNLGTNDIMVNIYKVSTGECVQCNVARTSINAISVGAFPAPASNDLRVLIQKIILA